jgi:hypothetical protein
MLTYDKIHNYYYFDNLNFRHGFAKTLPEFTSSAICLGAEQTHSPLIELIKAPLVKQSLVVPKVDGLLFLGKSSKRICLYVKSADCLPILLYSKKDYLFGAVHMGYKGALNNIINNLFSYLKELKIDLNNLKIVFGPSINGACYNIPMGRYNRFAAKFKHSSQFLFTGQNQYYLSLTAFAYFQLRKLGVPRRAFTWQPLCTHCQADLFYSFRAGDRNHNLFNFIVND